MRTVLLVLVLAIGLVMTASSKACAYGRCYTHRYSYCGPYGCTMVTCTTCCTGNSCNTTCY
jgi:hypothetical protein